MTKLEICNLALARLGHKPIISVSVTTDPVAVTCNALFDHTAAEELRDYAGSFCQTRATLVLDQTETDDNGQYDYAYDIPANSLRVLSVVNTTDRDEQVEFVLRGDHVYTDQEYAEIVYVDARATNPETMVPDRGFVTALSYRLAADLCLQLNGELGRQNQLLQLHERELGKAKRIAHSQTLRPLTFPNPYLEARK